MNIAERLITLIKARKYLYNTEKTKKIDILDEQIDIYTKYLDLPIYLTIKYMSNNDLKKIKEENLKYYKMRLNTKLKLIDNKSYKSNRIVLNNLKSDIALLETYTLEEYREYLYKLLKVKKYDTPHKKNDNNEFIFDYLINNDLKTKTDILLKKQNQNLLHKEYNIIVSNDILNLYDENNKYKEIIFDTINTTLKKKYIYIFKNNTITIKYYIPNIILDLFDYFNILKNNINEIYLSLQTNYDVTSDANFYLNPNNPKDLSKEELLLKYKKIIDDINNIINELMNIDEEKKYYFNELKDDEENLNNLYESLKGKKYSLSLNKIKEIISNNLIKESILDYKEYIIKEQIINEYNYKYKNFKELKEEKNNNALLLKKSTK